MKLVIKKSSLLTGSIIPPSSKSQCIRGMIFAMLASGKSLLNNALHSEDSEDAIRACQSLGAEITLNHDALIVNSTELTLKTNSGIIYTGNSGITTRFILPVLGLRKNAQEPIILDCGAQMRARPIQSLVNALRNLGMSIRYNQNEGVLPITVAGSLRGGKTEVDGTTSQYLSALLISLPLAETDSEIIVKNLNERPYVNMTLAWLKQQQIQYMQETLNNVDIFRIKGRQGYQNFNVVIPGDFSSASYLIAAAAMTQGKITLHGLDMQDPQGDKRLVHILQSMGANIVVGAGQLTIYGGNKLKGARIDANDIPDLLPTLAVIGTQAESETHIYNVPQARIKETDRIHSMTEGLTRLGANIIENHDGMIIRKSHLQGADVSGYGDHRTVMALSLAGMLAENTTRISNAEAINKTFPKFVTAMCSVGANIEVIHD